MAVVLNSCRKTVVQPSFDSVFSEPYTTGMIKFQYKTLSMINGDTLTVDTTVLFASDQSDIYDPYVFGYWDPSVPWFQVMRLNTPNDYHRAAIYLESTDFDKLTLPYTFKAGDIQMADLVYWLGGFRTVYDNQGNPSYEERAYTATTFNDNFQLTILSKTNDRVQGTFSGIADYPDSVSIDIGQGLFDVKIIRK